jgi:hypothetical protein
MQASNPSQPEAIQIRAIQGLDFDGRVSLDPEKYRSHSSSSEEHTSGYASDEVLPRLRFKSDRDEDETYFSDFEPDSPDVFEDKSLTKELDPGTRTKSLSVESKESHAADKTPSLSKDSKAKKVLDSSVGCDTGYTSTSSFPSEKSRARAKSIEENVKKKLKLDSISMPTSTSAEVFQKNMMASESKCQGFFKSVRKFSKRSKPERRNSYHTNQKKKSVEEKKSSSVPGAETGVSGEDKGKKMAEAVRPIGFKYDSDGFLEVHLHGMTIDEPTGRGRAYEVISFGIWFEEGNPM